VTVVLTGEQPRARLWDLVDGSEMEPIDLEDATVVQGRFRGASRLLLVGTKNVLQMLNLAAPAEGWSMAVEGPAVNIRSIAWGRNEDEVIAGHRNGRVILVDRKARTVRPLGQFHRGSVEALDVSPDRRWLLSGGQDREVQLRELGSGEVLGRFDGHTAAVTAVVFCPDGKHALSADSDGLAFLWDLARPTRPAP
jgi:WD40 repeat protein